MSADGAGQATEAPEEGCLFCRIIDGLVPSDSVLATPRTYAFRDIEPVAPVHVLVVPKAHIADVAAVGPDDGPLLAELLGAARQVAEQEGLAERGYRLVFNVGEDAQNSVAHLHLHVVGGRRLEWPPG